MKKILIANWKMSVGARESVALARGVLLCLRGKKILPEVVACPPFVALADVHKVSARSSLRLGAQDLFWETSGAYTGEISARMLAELGVTHAIIGHSERREHLGETDAMINKKVKAALAAGLTPILCIGEGRDAKDAGRAEETIRYQVGAALEGVSLRARSELLIAYEPVWAISTSAGAEAETPTEAASAMDLVRKVAAEHVGGSTGIYVLYGGSVDDKNAYAFLRENAIDGLFVGGASLKLSQFSEIIQAAIDLLEGTLKE